MSVLRWGWNGRLFQDGRSGREAPLEELPHGRCLMAPDPVELHIGAPEVVVGATDVQFPQCVRDLIEGRADFPAPTLTGAGKPMQKPVVRLQVGAG